MTEKILAYYPVSATALATPFGSGLINSTWHVADGDNEYILQRVNDRIFKNPRHIADNIETIAAYLRQHHPAYFFVKAVETTAGDTLVHLAEEGYFRLFAFVKDSHTIDVVKTPQQAFEAARQFGRFTKKLRSLPADALNNTLPDFHNLSKRYSQFKDACKYGNPARLVQAAAEIEFLYAQDHIVATYETIIASPHFKLRVTHHDTKISNVLFNVNNEGICVIDLDTVMPGYFISDVGDMLRTYLSPVSEEEKNFSAIDTREAYFEAIVQGYLHEMANELTEEELDHFVYAGMFMIYMQAMRFLTDHLNNDTYYGAAYAGQNFVRAQNQVTLLQRLLHHADEFKQLVSAGAAKLL